MLKRIFPTVTEADTRHVAKFSRDLNTFKMQLLDLFPERKFLIEQFLISLVSGQHLLIYGTYGTAKSLLGSVVLHGIKGKGINGEDPRIFEIQLDNETTADKIIGMPSMKAWEKDDIVKLNIDGFLPTAHFALLDELFDAVSVLRSINDMLNERELREGQLVIPVPLMTAVATTNRSPEEVAELYHTLQLGAVNDRFLTIAEVKPLATDEGKDDMIDNFLMNSQLEASLDFTDLQKLVKIIKERNLFPDNQYETVYRAVIDAFRKKIGDKQFVSDRRMAWLTQAVEARAVISGRTTLLYDDIGAVIYGLAKNESDPVVAVFQEAARPILSAAAEADAKNIDQAVRLQLDQVETDLANLRQVVNSGYWPRDAGEVGSALQRVKQINNALRGIIPQTSLNEKRRGDLMGKVNQLQETILQKTPAS